MSSDQGLPNGIAILGLACRFPGARDAAELWRNLRDGVESIRRFSDAELRAAGVDPALLADPAYVKAKAVLDDVALFDAGFFGFSPRIAEITDPQQRVFLECAWEALEDAGCDPQRHPGEIGIFAGSGLPTYLLANLGSAAFAAAGALQAAIGNRADHLTLAVAYKLDLRGPAVTVQTTCSTSLVAVHLACQSLLNFQCDMALAGGVSIEVPQHKGYLYVEGGIGSPDGHCRPFDVRARGTVAGSGAGVVVLKRLEDALADGDPVRAVILGSAVNNDGAHKIGYTAPNVDRQARAIALAQAMAGVRPDDIGYIETHGTGTPLGDPIEIAALDKVFRPKTSRRAFCALGAVKSNFGHLDTAAGIAGLIKTVLALEHGQIPPTLHFEQPNPEAGLADSPFFVNAALCDWPAGATPRRAGVSAFGIGGTNAHVVLEEAPAVPASERSGPSRPWQLLTLSARSGAALQAATERLHRHLVDHPELSLADVAVTLQTGRRAFAHRRVLVCRDDHQHAIALLSSLDPTLVYGSTQEPRRQPVAFLFPGQGAQRLGMGRGLYASEPEFRRQVDLCCDLLRPLLGLDLRAALWPDDESAEARARLDQTALAQPALFVVEYALARLWMSWGIAPVAMLGHSLGEYVAACLAEVFTLEDALRLVAARGRLIQALEPGAMLAVPLSEREAREWLSDEIALAAVNRPTLCTLAGPTVAVDRLEAELSGRGVVCRRLHTSHAFHSAMMEPALETFRAELRTIALRPPARPYISNRTGTWIRPEQATDPDFWVRHLRETVRFADGAETLLRETEALFLEVGPGATLAGLVRQHPARPPGRLALSSLRPPREGDPEEAALLTALGRLWLAGVEPDWQGFSAHERRRRVALPTYPFERQRYWCETAAGPAAGSPRAGVRRDDPAEWFYTPSWRRSPLPLAPAAGSPAAPQSWLVFAGDAPLAGALMERLVRLGHEAVRVAPGDGFAEGGDGSFRIDPRRPEDAAALLTELARRGPLPERLLHLWTVSPAGADPDDSAEQRRQLDLGFHSLVALAQALGRLAPAALPPALQLDLVSSNLHEVVGDDLWWPEKAAALGPLRALPKELAGVHCRGLDVDTPRTPAAADAQLERLLAELLAPAGPDQPVVAYRGPHRWVPEFAPLPLPAPASPLSRLRPGGSYLITGGLGGVGLTFAEELARAAGARLTLLGRSGLPPREEWDGWLAGHGEDDATSRRLLRLRQIEELGGEVLVVAADVADEAQVRAAVAAARERFGAVHGVVHAAGVSTGGLLQLRTARQIDEVLAPKIQGTRALAAALAPGTLDFFLLCSSRSAFLARAGGADYAGANAFLDAFAHRGRAAWGEGLVAVDWCAWRDVGMLADAARQARAARSESGAGAGPRVGKGERDLPAGEPTPHPLLERRQAASDGGGDAFFVRFSARRQWVANEHRIAGHPVIPGTTYLEMARAAFEQRTGQTAVELYDIFFLAPVRLRDDEERLLRLTLEPDGDGFAFRVSNRAAGRDWEETMLGRLRPLHSEAEPRRHDLAELRRRCSRPVPDDYERLEDFGPRWQNVRQLHVGPGEVLGLLELSEEFAGDLAQFRLHPSLLDRGAALAAQCRAYLLDDRHAELIHSFYLPLSYASLKVHAPLPRRIYSHVRLRDLDYARNETVTFDALLLDEEGRELVEIAGYSTKRVNNAQEQMRALTTLAAEPTGGGSESAEGAAAGVGSDGDGDGGPTMFDQALELGITPAEGQEVLRRVLAAHPLPPQVVVSPGDLAAAIAEAAAADPARLLEAAGDLAAGSRELHDRPDLGTPYAAPRNGMEEQLAALWQEALGVARVGIDDNFFELGGDSVLGIQVVARAHRLGLQISPAQLFEYQTIAQLAGVLQAGASPGAPAATPLPEAALDTGSSESGEGGEVPLIPNQVRLFERGYSNPHRLNIAQLFEAHIPLDWRRLDAILAGLGRDHDALRLRFSPSGAGGASAGPGTSDSWRQELTPATPDSGPAFSLLDLAALPADRQSRAIEQAAADLHDSLHLTRGPLVRLAAFELGGDALGRRPSRLLFLGHHLVLDHISVYILADDIGRLYEAAETGREPSRALTSAPYQVWAQRLHRFAGSPEIAEEASYWLNLPWERTVRLPLDFPTGQNISRSARTVTITLTAEETCALLDELPHALAATVEEVLLAAVAWGLSTWTGAPVQLLQRVGHGRISPFADLEISRTVGWFALDYPVVLDLAAATDPRAAVQAVVDQMRRVPREGVGYGLLRYLARQPDLAARFRALPAAEVSFNYIGREGLRRARRETAFREAAESSGDGFGQDVRRPSLLNVRTFLTGDCLQLSFTYSEAIHRAATVERLAAGCSAALAELLDALTTRELT